MSRYGQWVTSILAMMQMTTGEYGGSRKKKMVRKVVLLDLKKGMIFCLVSDLREAMNEGVIGGIKNDRKNVTAMN